MKSKFRPADGTRGNGPSLVKNKGSQADFLQHMEHIPGNRGADTAPPELGPAGPGPAAEGAPGAGTR